MEIVDNEVYEAGSSGGFSPVSSSPPRELDLLQKQNCLPNLTETMTITIDGKTMPMYSDEEKQVSRQFSNMSKFGFDFLHCCMENGVYYNEQGKKLLDQINDYFGGIDINDKELASNIQLWYEGKFCPGYYMNDNNYEFAEYLKSIISEKIPDID